MTLRKPDSGVVLTEKSDSGEKLSAACASRVLVQLRKVKDGDPSHGHWRIGDPKNVEQDRARIRQSWNKTKLE